MQHGISIQVLHITKLMIIIDLCVCVYICDWTLNGIIIT